MKSSNAKQFMPKAKSKTAKGLFKTGAIKPSMGKKATKDTLHYAVKVHGQKVGG